MPDDEELIFTEDDEPVLVDTSGAGAQEAIQEFLNLDDQNRLVSWAAIAAQPRSSTAGYWINALGVSTADQALTALLNDDAVSTWADGCSDIINRSIDFLTQYFAGNDAQTLKISWRNLSEDQKQWAHFLDEQLEGGGGLAEWRMNVGAATDLSAFGR